jgi:hypothetical protein
MACGMRDQICVGTQKQTTIEPCETRIQRVMECAEYQELELAYRVAVRRWAQHAHPQNMDQSDGDLLQRSAALRQQALIEWNSAADALHLHRRHCLVCRRQGAA